MPSPRANRRGMLAMVGSMAAYSVSDALTKLASKSLPLGEVLAILTGDSGDEGSGHVSGLRLAVADREPESYGSGQ